MVQSDVIPSDTLVEMNCFDPWLIAYSRARSEHIAKSSLEAEGFECWYPLRKVVATRPQRSLPSKTRHRRRFEVVERTEPVLGGYLFIRRLHGSFDLNSTRELHGVGGLCLLGGRQATLSDVDIEILRIAEADGRFNVYHAAVPGPYLMGMNVDPRYLPLANLGPQYAGSTRNLGTRLDKFGNEVHFVEQLGRVIRRIRDLKADGSPD